ncbi:ArgE/DapE family deacylase [Candidatus Bathyarchaeota archaeon]|nr:ArgE/DapE family deacylase [Candidatus Bathyarchaeota archaeon]
MSMVSSIDRGHMVGLLKDLVSIDSVNPSLVPDSAGEKEISDYIEDWMLSLGLETERYDVKPNRPNVVGVLKGSGKGKTLLLNGHTDTVGVDYMEIDPFEPVVKEGRLYGRGSFDMKGGLTASMSAVKAVIDSGEELKGDVILAAVCDEEYASIGTERLMEDIRADAAIIGEFTAENIQIAHKGFAWIDLETRGLAAHGSAYKVGVDAIAKMGYVLIGLEALQKILEEIEHPLVGPPSVHASIIEGGRELSTYPDKCMLKIERRLIPGENKEDVDKELRDMLASISEGDPKFAASYEITFYRAPMEIGEDEEICRMLRKGARDITNRTPEWIGGSGWMDTQIIWSKGIPAVAHGPFGEGAHAKEEWVDLDSVYRVAQVHEYAIRNFCGVT